MTEEALTQIEGIGGIVAQSIAHYFSISNNQQEVQWLLECGIKPHTTDISIVEGHEFNGKSFVLTGALQNYTRNEAANLIKVRGGRISEAVSKKTDFLLVGEDPGSKFEKAKALGVKILYCSRARN